VERTPLRVLRPDDETLLSLSAWEAMEEDRLTREIMAFITAESAGTRPVVDGGFDRSWTDSGDTRIGTDVSVHQGAAHPLTDPGSQVS
jgi:hypothetical protein